MKLGSARGLLVSLGFFAATAHAVVVTSIFDSQATFEVVTEQANETDPAPGIYGLAKTTDIATPLVMGHVLGVSRAFNGIQLQLSTGYETGRNESMAVLDGRLVIFTRNSRPNDSSTVVQLGGAKGLLPIDPLTKVAFELAPITAVGDVHIVEKSINPRQSLVIVSQKQDSPMGDGATYAFVTEPPAQRNKSSILRLAAAPLMLNHYFMDPAKLNQLMAARDYTNASPPQSVYSHIVLNALSHPRYNDTPTKAKWRKNLQDKIRSLPTSVAKEKLFRQTKWVPNSLPWLDVLTGSPMLPSYPVQTLAEEGVVAIVQREDPIRDVDHVYISYINSAEMKAPESTFGRATPPSDGISGRVNLSIDSRRSPLIFSSGTKSDWRPAPEFTIQNFESFGAMDDVRNQSTMSKINDQFHISFRDNNSGNVATFNLQKLMNLDLGGVNRLNYVHYTFAALGPKFPEHTLIISYARERTTKTMAVTFYSDGVNFTPGRVTQLDKRFQKPEQIDKRVLAYKQGLFYDALSSDREISNLIANREKATGLARSPYLDLETEANVFLRAKEKIELVKGLSWLSFESFPSVTNDATGIYQLGTEKTERRKMLKVVSPGQMLHRISDLQRDGDNTRLKPLALLPVAALTEDDLAVESQKEVLGGYKVLIYASEAMKNSSRTSFTIALDQDKLPVSNLTIQVPLPFSQFVDVHIIRHRRDAKNSFSAIFFMKEKGKVKHSGGVYVANFTVKRDTGEWSASNPFKIVQGAYGWITRDEIDPVLIKSRVVFDALGGPLWLENPHLDKNDEEFTVIRLEMADRGHSTLDQLTADVNFTESINDNELQKSTLSDWAIYFPDKIAKRRPDLKLNIESKKESKKEAEAREKKLAETEATFPNLNPYLDQLVDDSTKPRATVLLVEKDMKAQFLEGMFDRFARNRGGQFSFTNDGFHFYMLQPESTPVKYRQELVNVVRKTGKKLLFVDGRDLISAQQASDVDGEEDAKEDDKKAEQESEEKEHPSEADIVTAKLDDLIAKDAENVARRKPPERFTAPLIRMLAAEGNDKHVSSVDQVADLPHRIPMVMVMTPYEWRRLHEENGEDARAYLDKRFKVDARFLTSGWAVWSPRSSRAKPEIKQIASAGVSLDAVRVFDQLNAVLTDAVNPDKKPKHQILIYPEELGPLMEKLILGRWASESAAMNTPWNHRNADMALLRLPKPKDGAKVTQQSVFENYGGLKEIRKSKKPVILAQLSDLNQIGRPEAEAGSSTFMLRDPSAGATAGDLKVTNGDDGETESGTKSRNPPHLLWMMATEGSKLQPTLSKDWSVRDEAPVETSTIIYGTEAEFNRLRGEVSFESRFGNLTDAFEVIHLQEPAVELRRQLVREIFQRHQLRNLDLTFRVGDSAPKADPTDLVSILISRIEQQAAVAGQDPTTAFIRVYSLVQSFVSEDPTLRETRIVDKAAVERLLTFVFPTGLKPDSLPPTHPINIVKDTTKAALSWQKTGYRGYADLKRQILEQYYSQTESVQDTGKQVRFSTILFGPTSTGKSYLLQTLFDMLKLRPLDALNPSFRESDYYFVKVHELTDEDGIMSVEKSLLRAEQLLCNNPQAHIVFDDLHKAASTKMLKRIIAWMSAIFDANKGMISFRCNENERREVPVMNMGLHITVNPTTDQKLRERINGKDYLEKEILAGLSREDFILENSFLARVTAKFNMEKFPAGAKFATLINDARKASQSEFISKEALVMVSPLAVQRLVDRFGDANAREFSSNATVALMQISHDLPKSPVYIVDLKNTWKRKLLDQDITGFDPNGKAASSDFPMGRAEVSRDSIKTAIQEIVTFRAVDGDNAGSMLDFVSFIVDGFRIHAYQTMLDGLMDDEHLNANRVSQQHFIGEMLLATFDSLVEWGTVPLNNLNLHPRDLGWPNEGKIPEFLDALKERSEKPGLEKKYFRYNFTARGSAASNDTMDSVEEIDKRTLDVLSETALELREVMADLMKAYFRVQSLQNLPTTSDWFNGLPDLEKKGTAEDPGISQLRESLYQAGQRMTSIYIDFTAKLFDPELLDRKISSSRVKQPLAKIGSYDQARLFLQALDKAVVSLPWAKMTHFAWQNMKEASQDMNMGHLPRFQQLLFKSEFSPYGTVTPDSIFQSVSGNPLYKNLSERDRRARRDQFNRDCQLLLLTDSNIVPLREGETR